MKIRVVTVFELKHYWHFTVFIGIFVYKNKKKCDCECVKTNTFDETNEINYYFKFLLRSVKCRHSKKNIKKNVQNIENILKTQKSGLI